MTLTRSMYKALDEERFWAQAVIADGCWHWTGPLTIHGYGMMTWAGQRMHAHRASWFLHHPGADIDGLHVDHLCRNRWCVNPEHLEPVTVGENVRRGAVLKTACKRGHPLDGVSNRGWRFCKTCAREAQRRYKAGRA